ncbi:MAG TPA: UpxY family transcription antiterminator [Terriglobia bacterium]|nr:UpxY family transcription antiterminator [Terriglobia bacterium]
MSSWTLTIPGRESANHNGANSLAASSLEPRWYAAYTCANHENRVSEQLAAREVEHFLPVYRSVRRWRDRRVELELPLFPGYVFVRLALRDRLRVLQIPSVARLVGFGGSPAALPDEEMEILRAGLNSRLVAAPHPYLMGGRRVRVTRGPLAGMQGILLRRRGKARFVISMELIMRSMSVEIDEANLEAV